MVTQIHEYKGRQELYLRQRPEALDKLIEIAKVQSTEASNEIEGIRTTNTRLKQLVADKTTPRNQDKEEIMGYRDVLNTIHESNPYIPLRTNYILQLHRDLFQYSEKGIGGHFKNTQNYLTATDAQGNSFVLFTLLAPHETPAAVDAICESYNTMDEDTCGLYRRAMAAFGGIAPSYHIELLNKPTIYWDFHSLLLGIQMMFSFLLVDEDQPLRLCKRCHKVFWAAAPMRPFAVHGVRTSITSTKTARNPGEKRSDEETGTAI